MERMKKALGGQNKKILSLSMAAIGSHDFSEFSERLDMMVEAGMDQLLLITYNSEVFRLAEIAPAEQMMVNQGIAGGKYSEMFLDTVRFARTRYPDLPIIVTPMIGDAISFGIPNFVRMCRRVGVDGMDTAQYPAIKDPVNFRRLTEKEGMGFVCAINGGAVRMEDSRAVTAMEELVRITSGELFYVPALPGTDQDMDGESLRPCIRHIRKVQEESGNICPIVSIGGISTLEQVYQVVKVAGTDGVHFSSAFMKRLFAGEPLEKIGSWLKEVKDGMEGM